MSFSPQDLQDLASRGISVAEAERQLGLFVEAPAATELDRPCTVGDGILRLNESDQAKYERLGHEHLKLGNLTKFVPASGAATRMFKDCLQALEQKDGMPQGPVAELLTQAERLAFYGVWKKALGVESDKAFAMRMATGHWRESLKTLVLSPGLNYSQVPKALLPFHTVTAGARTALEEHLHEALQLSADHAHFTVSAEHRAGFEALLAELNLPLAVSLSEQAPSTDTLAAELDGSPFRDGTGRLVFRPGGHGALLHNLQTLANAGHSQVMIKNIDNISHSRLWPLALKWKRILVGILAELGPQDLPLRVVGVVPNTGEAGGGPFWVRHAQGNVTAQIVESAQVDLTAPVQNKVFQSSTHFNPVDLVCRLTNKASKPFDLNVFRDPNAVFLSRKTHLGRPLRALELPGLWNGAMAQWRTIFVEVPGETFNPVKSVNDLLKPAHQP